MYLAIYVANNQKISGKWYYDNVRSIQKSSFKFVILKNQLMAILHAI